MTGAFEVADNDGYSAAPLRHEQFKAVEDQQSSSEDNNNDFHEEIKINVNINNDDDDEDSEDEPDSNKNDPNAYENAEVNIT